MSNDSIRPSSLDGIKRLAKSLKRERGIPHLQALDEAARKGNFQNFRHARGVLLARGTPAAAPAGHLTYVTVYWKDRKAGGDGRETLPVRLSVPWGELITPAQLPHHRAFVRFRGSAPDHLERDAMAETQSHARGLACAAARTLQFMDATKLRPSRSHSRAFPGGRSVNAVPERDHYSIWYDRATKRYLFVDEPYEKAVAAHAGERAAWAARHSQVIVQPNWPGMYNPDGGTRLYLISDAEQGVPLPPIATALDALPTPVVEASWNGESAPILPLFFSPGAPTRPVTLPRVERAAKPGAPRNTLGYVQTFVGPQRRPKGRMPIEVHAEVGQLLKSVLAVSYHRDGVHKRVDAVRSELDEWTQREYTHAELPNEEFFDLYYHGDHSTFQRSLSREEGERHVRSLEVAKQRLAEHYPDCAPLRSVLKKLDAAIASLQGWTR
jgi:hypothetical protein